MVNGSAARCPSETPSMMNAQAPVSLGILPNGAPLALVVNRSWRGFLVVSSDPVTLRGCSCGAGRAFAAAGSLRSVRSACDAWGQRPAAPGTGRAGRGRGGCAHAGVPARRLPGREGMPWSGGRRGVRLLRSWRRGQRQQVQPGGGGHHVVALAGPRLFDGEAGVVPPGPPCGDEPQRVRGDVAADDLDGRGQGRSGGALAGADAGGDRITQRGGADPRGLGAGRGGDRGAGDPQRLVRGDGGDRRPVRPGGGGGGDGLPAGQGLLFLQVDQLDGLITNGKFCCVRQVRLSLTWWRRPLRLRRSLLQSDVALIGEPDDPYLDRLPSVQPAPRTASAGGIRPISCWRAGPGRAACPA